MNSREKLILEEPLNYLKDYDEQGFEKVLQSHLIPICILEWSRENALLDDALRVFIEERISLLLEALRHKLDGTSSKISGKPRTSGRGGTGG